LGQIANDLDRISYIEPQATPCLPRTISGETGNKSLGSGSCALGEVAVMGESAGQRNVERLVEAHYQALYRYAYRLAGSASDAEDLTQEAFCTAQRKWGQLRDPERAKSWLFSILRNAYLHRLRTDKQQRFVSLDGIEDLAEAPTEPLPPVEPERLQEALNELPEVFRTPILLYYFEEFSYRDIAEQMDLPIGTVMSRLARAKAHLRSRLLQPAAAGLANGGGRATDGL
jgi:RNA polymerase sigma-70 factor (ECF subfamily)